MDNQLFGPSAYKGQDHSNRNFPRPSNSPYIQQVAWDGKTMPSLVDLEQFPLQMSAECYYNVGPYVLGQTISGNFSSPASGNTYSIGESNNKITAARVPYFDGDYWSCAIEDMIRIIEKEREEDSVKKLKIHTTKRTLRAMGHSDLSVKDTKDILVMQKLGQTILPLKENFLVVHLQFTCTNCLEPILSGSRWSCDHCCKYHICHRCFVLERNSSKPETHTSVHGEKHQLFQIGIADGPSEICSKFSAVLGSTFMGALGE